MNKRAEFRPKKVEEMAILQEAVEAFAKTAKLPVPSVKEDVNLPEGVDFVVGLAGGQQLFIEFKRTLTPANLGQAVAQLGRFGKPGAIVTRYVTPPMAEQLRMLDVPFMDTAGNAYVRFPDLVVFVTGRKPAAPAPTEKRVRAFRPTGLKVIFALLCRPELIAAPYRDIAKAAGVALGAVAWVLQDLKKLGHMRKTKARGRVLEERQRLIDRWVEAYAHELRPKLKPRRFKVTNQDWWKQEDLVALDMWLGGEPAAAVLTKHLRPEIVTIYGDVNFAELAHKIRPIKDEYGNLELMQKFWTFEIQPLDKRYPVVPPLLAYADLVATADARNLETAQILRERFLGDD